jgi:hypothetical protein
MSERVPGVAVGAVLRHDDVRAERGGELRHDPLDDAEPDGLPGLRLERDVDDGAGRGPLPDLGGEPRHGREQVARALVDRDRHHARIRRVDHLDAVAVMDVEVDVEDAEPGRPGPGDRERDVVVDAEPRGTVGHRVVEAATGMERADRATLEDRVHRPKRAAGDGSRGLVHAGERRVVAAEADPGRRLDPAVLDHREEPDGLDVAGRVADGQFVVARGLGCQARRGTERLQEVDPRPEPARRQRMGGPEVVVERPRAEDEDRRAGHGGTIPTMERVYTTPILDKLGIRPGMRVAIVGDHDADPEMAELRREIADRTSDVTDGEPAPDTDVVLLAADSTADLDLLRDLRARIRPNGAIWIVSRKGKAATLRDVEVMAAGRAHDLIDNKVVAFSSTRTALRLVIPVALRPRT